MSGMWTKTLASVALVATLGCGGSSTPSGATPDPSGPGTEAPSREAEIAAARQQLREAIDDGGEPYGMLRAVHELLRLVDRGATPLLVEAVELSGRGSGNPYLVIALGSLGDASAAEALLRKRALYLPNEGSFTIAARSRFGLAALGPAATASTIEMLAGGDDWVTHVKAEGLPPEWIPMRAAEVLGDLGDTEAVPALLAVAQTCPSPRKGPAGMSAQVCREVYVALGKLGDSRAVATLCDKVRPEMESTGSIELVVALGRIGGPAAAQCLAKYVESGVRSTEADYALWAVTLAADARTLTSLEHAHEVVRSSSAREEQAGTLALARRCRDDLGCFRTALEDPKTPWRERELAAYRVVRLSPDDPSLPLTLARAFALEYAASIRAGEEEFDERGTESLAWLVIRAAGGKPCPACLEPIQSSLDGKPSLHPDWLSRTDDAARVALGRVGPPGRNFDRALLPPIPERGGDAKRDWDPKGDSKREPPAPSGARGEAKAPSREAGERADGKRPE